MPLEKSITLESQQNYQTEQKPTPCPLPWERGKRTRRSSVTIGVRSGTMQAWDRRNAGTTQRAP